MFFMASCFNVKKINISHPRIDAITIISFNTLKLDLGADVANGNDKILLKEAKIDILIDDEKKAVLTTADIVVIPKGYNEIDFAVHITLRGGLLGGVSLIDEDDLGSKKMTANGYVKFKYLGVYKTVKIDNVPINKLFREFDFGNSLESVRLF